MPNGLPELDEDDGVEILESDDDLIVMQRKIAVAAEALLATRKCPNAPASAAKGKGPAAAAFSAAKGKGPAAAAFSAAKGKGPAVGQEEPAGKRSEWEGHLCCCCC
jgi:hypothetical protein